ncbi:NADP-dependent oxidoreductase domain-containing protein [Dunaliella salina]|uniref:NADP-dependent oxidoreductase domain-containing protein n=1 Tax=Dunaliella salina TaxID=3046 RepID=A0ABQ7H9K0_DUNSA|nr:NADP-dependent oxidoreductase domain-containing protein [Dunaliella salina]|eukprot:KAF5843532.1 NADP-dependent oxidoreductase domain-containing protein [Dunaliella salina]
MSFDIVVSPLETPEAGLAHETCPLVVTVYNTTKHTQLLSTLSALAESQLELLSSIMPQHAIQEVEPVEVMMLLNTLFSLFDELVDQFGVQKVETAGDCYIVSGGIMSPSNQADGGLGLVSEDHDHVESATRVMEFAKAMLEVAQQVKLPNSEDRVRVRVGMHTGDVVSGLIGSKLPKFSIFGDTMNTCSRMESTGTAGRIHVSETTHKLLRHKERWQSTGGVEVKGKGQMQTYLWVPSSDSPAIKLFENVKFEKVSTRPSVRATISSATSATMATPLTQSDTLYNKKTIPLLGLGTWNSKNIEEGIQKTLSDLQLSYLDLYLVHAPASAEPGPTVKPPLIDQWRIMESLHDKGLAKAIGVSNFSNKKLQGILEQCRIKPHAHQAYSPLGTPDSAEMMKRTPDQPIPLQDPVVLEVAKKMNKTPAQVLLRYGIQRGMSVVPKSVHAERIKENTDVFDWSLSEEDFKALHTRPNQVRLCHLGFMLNPEGPYKTMEDLWEN